ncbi:hypothetical protein [Bacillus sp. JCM 19041]|uniref:hypothetical protein n=1 Tax=Bacillus sp. JCM 19041 TaxID=1460637 RepID=UPI000AC037A8
MSYLSLTTWSLHRLLGPLHWTKWDEQAKEQVTAIDEQPQVHTLLELPRILSEKGFQAMEVIHPHFPSTDDTYLKQFRKSFEEAGIRFFSLLIDYGDITSTDLYDEKRIWNLSRLDRCGANSGRGICPCYWWRE